MSSAAELQPTIYATGWNALLSRPPKIESNEVALAIDPPKSLSLRLKQVALKVQSFTFPEAPAWMHASPPPTGSAPKDVPAADQGQPAKGVTRILPPGDIIKLEDRLYYLLQPPLEAIMGSSEVHLPFEPFPYQFQGIAFLYPRYSAVLADEMGLGKTMQAVTTIRLLLRAAEIRRVLLVCPKPLVTNWRREFSVWAPEIPLCIIEGDQAKRHWQWKELDSPVKIANYELLMRDREVVLDSGLHFDLVALDEAQRVKNKNGTTSEICRAISRNRSWALTGTPVENSTDDLVGIFEFLSPGYLHTGMSARRMSEAAGEYILRRTKDMVLQDMPPKMFRDAELDLTPEQFATYEMAEKEGVIKLEHMAEELTIQHVFELVLRLKQICNFDPVTGASSKLERLEADLEEVAASGQKAIIFSQWVHSLHRLKERLARFGVCEYHGQIPSKQRDPILTRFREDPSTHVILMSYGAGAVGLNLQFCRYVFLFDRWWNPAIEDQAINRAHRIGCAGSVTITRMLTLGTIEERINQVLEEKRQLFAAVIDQTDSPRQLGLTHDDIFGLFNLRTPSKAVTKKVA